MTQTSQDFYKNLEELEELKNISNTSSYKILPKDWYIAVTDVKDSTKAIEQGHYKDVNMVGALTIISILNLNRSLDIPFIFGGDGSFILIPPTILEDSKQALLSVQKIAQDAYSLDLRIGMVPVKDIYNHKKELYVTKLKISKEYSQAIIKGGGLEFCDYLLKNDNKYQIIDNVNPDFQVDLEGLECRWQAIPSPKDETLSILIKAKDETHYENILQNLEVILGDTSTRHPIVKNNMKLSFSDTNLNTEASIYTQKFFEKLLILFKLKTINLLGYFLMKFKIDKWGTYKDRIVSTTDTEKFDDMLRMVVSTNFLQTKELEKYLESEYKKGTLYYGIHRSDSSLMTCLIFQRHGKHIHFVDATKGGYALAAKQLKRQLGF